MDADNINIAIAGEIYKVAAEAVVTGTGAVTGESYGYISEEGVVITPTAETKEIKAFQHGAVVRTIKSNGKVTIEITFLESTPNSRELWFGSAASAGGVYTWKPTDIIRGRFVVDMIGENGTINSRYDFPKCEVTEAKALSYVNGEPEEWGVTITATPDANGVVATVYTEA